MRTALRPFRNGEDHRRRLGFLVPLLLAAQALVACGGSGHSATPTINFYIYPDNSGAVQQAADTCTKSSGGKYVIKYQKLPSSADGQRQQMVRRLAARDTSMDILGLDVTWAPEFAEAGWIKEWTGDNRAQVEQGTLAGPLATATYKGKLYAAPFNSNTQLLWYRSDLVPTPPKTWDEMIDMATTLAKQGKPHLIEIQGNQYEGITVWFNTLLASAGGSVLTGDGTQPSLGPPAIKALSIMRRLATSPAADPSLSVQMEDDNRLAMESGTAAFELNYPFVFPSMKANQPKLFESFKAAPYPAVSADQPAHVTIGGINIAVSNYTRHPDEAFQAALCIRNRDNQKIGATKGGT
ncbi:MAG: trehalose/maltose transport system substrate-binding protein, partial [Acidimicrobiaceae bacterium]|nr:trehalose/maltose transport system substrate-binding protein [Acidimicrobiaceae bacterium]